MFDTAWVPPQQLTSLLMRRALSSSQMAAPGTLPCVCTRAHRQTLTYAHTHTQSCLPLLYTSQLLVASPPHPSLQQPLPRHFSPCIVTLLLSILFPPSSRLWQLLIHVAALQMSQLTSWENSRGGEGGWVGWLEGIGGVWFISLFDRETHQNI